MMSKCKNSDQDQSDSPRSQSPKNNPKEDLSKILALVAIIIIMASPMIVGVAAASGKLPPEEVNCLSDTVLKLAEITLPVLVILVIGRAIK